MPAHTAHSPDDDGAFRLPSHCQRITISTASSGTASGGNARHGELLQNQQVAQVAEEYGVTIPQLAIRYLLQLDLLPLPKTANPGSSPELPVKSAA